VSWEDIQDARIEALDDEQWEREETEDLTREADENLARTESATQWFDELNARQNGRDHEERAWWLQQELQRETDEN